MAMALRSDVTGACRAGGVEKPIDLVFLSAQTMGDRGLEKDILNLFLSQAPEFLIAVEQASSADDVKRVAHTLKGAAKSIGAFQLAELAEASEQEFAFDVEAVNREIGKVCKYIRSFDD